MGLFGGGDGGFLGSVGKVFGEVTETIFSLPNQITNFGMQLGQQQQQFLQNQSGTIYEQQRQFQTRQAGIGIADFVNNNPLIVFGGIGLILFLVFRR